MSIINKNDSFSLKLFSLAWPIFTDNFLRMLVLVASYALISRISDSMAGILGVANLFLLVGFTFCECLAQGSSIILAQFLGAKKELQVCETYVIMIWLNLIVGLIFSIIFANYSYHLLSIFNFPLQIIQDGTYYLRFVGSGFFIYSFNYALLYIINANGRTKYCMAYSILTNGISLTFYYLIATLPNKFSVNHLTLIAFTNFSVRCLGMIFLLVVIRSFVSHFHIYIKIPWVKIKKYLSQFFRISFPNAVEPFSHQLFQFALVSIISMISIESLAIRSYIISLTALFETGASSIARGNQIILGHFIGAQKIDHVVRQLNKGLMASLLVSIIILFLGVTFRYQLMRFFSKDFVIIDMGANLLFLVAALTLVRSFTFNLYGGLKATGDMKFGFLLTVFGMWCIALPGSYALARFGMGLNGIWVMLVVEEIIRGFILFQRWKGEKWRSFCLVKAE